MTKIALLNIKGESIKDIKLKEEVWGIEPNTQTIYDAIVLATASLRQGTHQTKTRSEVSGGGRKPWRQKGTGRARQGSIRAPHWRGGGIIFGPHPRDYEKKQNKKERRLALKSALTFKALEKKVFVVDSLEFASPKTKDLLSILSNLKITGKTLIVVKELSDNAIMASRNIETVKLIAANEVNTYDVSAYDNLLITQDAINAIEEVLI